MTARIKCRRKMCVETDVLRGELYRQRQRLLRAGSQLANIAYNWAQSSRFTDSERKMLDECRREWDAAAKVPR